MKKDDDTVRWDLEHLVPGSSTGGKNTWLRWLLGIFLFFLLYSSLLPEIVNLLGLDQGGPATPIRPAKPSSQQQQTPKTKKVSQ